MQNNFLNFETKARNLQKLAPILQNAEVLPLMILKICEINFEEIATKIYRVFGNQKLIIRSSSCAEDNQDNSNAGAFLSLSNIDSVDSSKLILAIKEVAKKLDINDEILIQPMLKDILQCGVAFSVDKDNNSPYFYLEYDESGSNSFVTDGSSNHLITYTHFRDAPLPKDSKLKNIILLILELEKIFCHQALDIEFAYAKYNSEIKLYLLQVRPLVMSGKKNFYHLINNEILHRLSKRFNKLQFCHSDVLGSRTVFGVMPDWNPAEMIGFRPKRLALSLYKEIVTDNVWAYQRDNYGYRKLRSHPLMHSFCGIPYIDVRLSFNSFIPKDISPKTAKMLVEYYMQMLIETPQLHDKIEFDIVFSCYDFNMEKKLKKLLDYDFSQKQIIEIQQTLLKITNNILHPQKGLYLKDLHKIRGLREIYEDITCSNLSNIDQIYWLIENCKRYGTLPFAGIARAGFVAMQLLNSLVEIGFFSIKERLNFLNSLHTKAKQLSLEVAKLNPKNKQDFLREYGHLRAGTYNILSPRYDEDFDSYFDLEEKNLYPQQETFFISEDKIKRLDRLLQDKKLKINARDFLLFLKQAIEGREFAKFEFSRLLSKAISLIAKLGEYYGIDKELMAFVDIKTILDLYASLYAKNPRDRLLSEIKNNQQEYQYTLAIKLPSLLCNQDDIFFFTSNKTTPNFITQKVIFAPIAKEQDRDFENKIVLIYAADPGYDYIFSKNITGFITCYGGANSHMAIRASELSIPAVIGVGEEVFAQCMRAKNLRIDCQSEQIFYL